MLNKASLLLDDAFSNGQRALLLAVGEEAQARGSRAYLVGGAPRDLFLGIPIADLDVVVEGDAIGLARSLARRRGGKVTGHPRFGTATWSFGSRGLVQYGGQEASMLPDRIDFAAARSEAYPHAGSLPVTRSSGLDQDLARRDFSINTLAIALAPDDFGRVLDHFGAIQDLQKGVIRALHNASFRDDPTRMYRAVRYARRYGFRIAEPTLELIRQSRGFVSQVSGQRLKRELDLILGEKRAPEILQDLSRLGLLRAVDANLPRDRPSLSRVKTTLNQRRQCGILQDSVEIHWVLWLLRLDRREFRALQRRLPFRRQESEAIMAASTLRRNLAVVAHMGAAKTTAYLSEFPLLAVQAVCLSTVSPHAAKRIRHYLAEWRNVKLETTGADLQRRGIRPGPAYGEILRRLLAARLEGEVRDPAGEAAWLDARLGPAGMNASSRPAAANGISRPRRSR